MTKHITIVIEDSSSIQTIMPQLQCDTIFLFDSFEVVIVYQCGYFLRGEIFVIIAAYVRYLRDQNKAVTVVKNFDYEFCETIQYASRINFFKLVGLEYRETKNRHNNGGNFIEITPFYSCGFDATISFFKLFSTRFGINTALFNNFYCCFGEIVGNVETHAKAHEGLIYSQYFKAINKLVIVVVDCGLGIHSTLSKSEKYSHFTPMQSLEACIKQGVTNGEGCGNGLFWVSNYVIANKGTLSIISSGHELLINNGNISCRPICNWPGTSLYLEINLNNHVSVRDAYIDHDPNSFEDYLDANSSDGTIKETFNKYWQ